MKSETCRLNHSAGFGGCGIWRIRFYKEENKMRTFEYAIIDELGIHARPAEMLVKEVKK